MTYTDSEQKGFLVITDEDLEKAKKHPVLGPAYFAADRIVQQALKPFTDDVMRTIVDEFTSKIRDELNNKIQDEFFSSVELGIHHRFYNCVDDAVMALLSGQKWALERYTLGQYRQEEIRQKIAKHIPREIMDKRIVDLEEEIASLKRQLEWARR